MSDFVTFLVIGGGTALAGLLLAVEHLLCGPADSEGLRRIGVLERYSLGTLALVFCQAGVLALLGASLLVVVALVVVALGGGALLWLIYGIRQWLSARDEAAQAAQRAAGPLSQATIDLSERHRR